MKLILTTLTVIAFMCLAAPAMAYQIDVDPQEMHFKRLAKVRWDKEQQRERERLRDERERAAASAEVDEGTPTTVASGPASYPGGVLSADEVAAYARGAGFPETVIDTMVAIAWRESRFNPSAVNSSSGACGLWQMYPCPGPHALDPATNAAMAFAKWSASGLSPWGY